jgi:hypothetical protein
MSVLINNAVNWLPLLIFAGLILFTIIRARTQFNTYKADAAGVTTLNREILANNRRMLAVLEEISAELKQRKI